MTAPVLVVASLPPYCGPCGGTRRVQLAGPGGVALPVACPHCTPAAGARPLPIVALPALRDAPKETP